MMSRFQRQLGVVYGAHALNGVLGVITVPFTVKLLGFSGYGLFSIYSVLVSYALLADFGVGKNLMRLLAESPHPDNRENNLRVALALYLILAVAWFLAFPLLAFVIPRYVFPVTPGTVTGLRWMVLLSILEFALGIPASLMQTACVAEQRFESFAMFTVMTGLTRNGAILLGAVLFGSPLGIAAVLAGRKIIDTAIAGRTLGWLPRIAWVPIFHRRSFRAMLLRSAVLSAAQILYSVAMSVGSLLVNASFGIHALGVYRSAFDLAGKIAVVSNGVTLVVFPRAARHFGSSNPDPAPFTAGSRCSSILFACFAASAVLAAPWLLPIIGLGDAFTVSLFVLLVIALSLNAHSLLSNELLQAAGRYGSTVWFSLSALGAITLIFLLVKPATGMMAIGWAWIGGALFSACVADGLLLRMLATPALQQISSALAKFLATAACVGLASSFGVLADAGFIVVLLALLGSAVYSAVPFLRRPRTVNQAAVCV